MFTTCTNCHTRFRLAAAQLTAAQGQVRCGQCHQVFDAYEALEGADLPPEMPVRTGAEVETVETRGEQRKLRAPLQDVGAGLPAEQDAEREAPIHIRDEPAPELEMTLDAEDEPITSAPNLKVGSRKGPPPPIDDMFASLVDDDEPETLPLPEPLGEVKAAVEIAASPPDPLPMYADEVSNPASFAHVEDLHSPPASRPRRPLVSAAWWLGVLILVLALGAQLVDMDRAPLSQNPVIGPSLQALYAALGRPLSKQSSVSEWNVGALNVTTDPDSAGALSITGSLTNAAGFVQPWPTLRVVLTDRFGSALRSRDFKPTEYLAQGQAGAVLAPGLAARFRLDIVDPGADAVGFSLTPCLDMPAGRVCAASTTND